MNIVSLESLSERGVQPELEEPVHLHIQETALDELLEHQEHDQRENADRNRKEDKEVAHRVEQPEPVRGAQQHRHFH